MDSPKQIVFSEQAFLKATLHACQHPTTPVYGALLARPDGDELRIEAVVPLFHETPLGPLLEVAMTMIVKVRACSCGWLFIVAGGTDQQSSCGLRAWA